MDPYASMGEVVFTTYSIGSHQGAIELFWLHLSCDVVQSSFKSNNSVLLDERLNVCP